MAKILTFEGEGEVEESGGAIMTRVKICQSSSLKVSLELAKPAWEAWGRAAGEDRYILAARVAICDLEDYIKERSRAKRVKNFASQSIRAAQ